MWALVLFCISILGIVSLIVLKNWERRRGPLPVSTIRSRFDNGVVLLAAKMRSLFPATRDVAKVLLKFGILHVSSLMLVVVRFVERKLIRVINLVKGRGDITSKKGSVSFFLQNVSTYKEHQPAERS